MPFERNGEQSYSPMLATPAKRKISKVARTSPSQLSVQHVLTVSLGVKWQKRTNVGSATSFFVSNLWQRARKCFFPFMMHKHHIISLLSHVTVSHKLNCWPLWRNVQFQVPILRNLSAQRHLSLSYGMIRSMIQSYMNYTNGERNPLVVSWNSINRCCETWNTTWLLTFRCFELKLNSWIKLVKHNWDCARFSKN